jgi:hypothetical protein
MSRKARDYDQPSYETEATPATPAEPEAPPPEQRAKDLLTALTEAQRHNAPVTAWMLNELRELVGAITGTTPPKPLHAIRDSRGHSSNITFKDRDGQTQVIDTIEEALAYVRGLPIESQKLMHWRAADKALAEAVTYLPTGDVSPAARAFESAVHEDAKLNPRAVEVPERDPSLDPKPAPTPAPEPEATHA